MLTLLDFLLDLSQINQVQIGWLSWRFNAQVTTENSGPDLTSLGWYPLQYHSYSSFLFAIDVTLSDPRRNLLVYLYSETFQYLRRQVQLVVTRPSRFPLEFIKIANLLRREASHIIHRWPRHFGLRLR